MSQVNWILFLALAVIYWLLPRRMRAGVIATGSMGLLALNDFVAALIAVYMVLVALTGPAWAARQGRWGGLRLWLVSIALLLPLIVFKYQGVLGITQLAREGHGVFDPSMLALPLGISYVTFKALMYVLDCVKGRIQPEGLTGLIAYLAAAPALSAGPIDRPAELIPQLRSPARLSLDLIIYAGYRIALGVVFKFVIADTLMQLANPYTPSVLAMFPGKLLVFLPLYSLIIYFDFAGYSHIAIGAMALLGLRSMENFASPYLKPNISLFWRNWHMTLTGFLTTYMFLPLAYRWARRIGAERASYLATLATFIACGLWHGDGLNFAVWGVYQGLLLVAHQWFLKRTRKSAAWRRIRRQRWLMVPATLLTFVLISVGWLLFAFSLNDALAIMGVGR